MVDFIYHAPESYFTAAHQSAVCCVWSIMCFLMLTTPLCSHSCDHYRVWPPYCVDVCLVYVKQLLTSALCVSVLLHDAQAEFKSRSANRRSSASRGRAATNRTARWNPGVSGCSIIVHVPPSSFQFSTCRSQFDHSVHHLFFNVYNDFVLSS